MTLDDFLELADRRLPNADELIALCEDELRIGFALNAEGKFVLKHRTADKPLALLLARLIRREPWRTQIIEARIKKAEKTQEPPAAPEAVAGEIEILSFAGAVHARSADYVPRPEDGHSWRQKGDLAWTVIRRSEKSNAI